MVTFLVTCVQRRYRPVKVGVVVEPVGQRTVAVRGETLVEHMEGHILKGVVVQRHLEGKKQKNILEHYFKLALKRY